ncbi:MAG: hypothetical protein IJ594_07635, partial [Oscillospiraceae bacterium]|nr:hypothetical protein [Oscillospiraceae bacterium]
MDVLNEQLNLDVSPLSPRCVHCGAETSYDLVHQNYHCLFCGGVTGVRHPAARAEAWQERRQAALREEIWDAAPALYRCPGCGATLLSARADAGACPFCATALIRGALSRDLDVAPLALPFSLSPEQARAALKAWAGKNLLQKEARRITAALDKLEACYLPCRLVQGPVRFEVTRDDCTRSYRCRSYAQGVLVNDSAQVDSLLLSAAEPFDWGPARPFTPEMLSGARLKLHDLPETLLARRIDEELALHHLGSVERGLHSSSLHLRPDASDALCVPVLAPVYLLTTEGTRVMVNGQTGRVAVSRDKPSRSRERLLEPLILSLLAAIFWMYASGGNLELFILGTAACVVLIFALLSGPQGERLHRRLFRLRDPLAERYESRFFVADGDRTVEPPAAPAPVFYEVRGGEEIPVEMRYYTAPRILLGAAGAVVFIALPFLLACLFT